MATPWRVLSLVCGLALGLTRLAQADPAAPGALPVFDRLEAWTVGSNYGYHTKPGVDLKYEPGPASPAGGASAKVSFTGAGWAPKPFERDIYLSLPVQVNRTPGRMCWLAAQLMC